MNKMKQITLAAAMLAAVACNTKQESKVLVLYYSQTGNTQAVAEQMASLLGADLATIVATDPYDGDFQATINRCLQEREAGVLPEVEPLTVNLADYDLIFLGYPVWFGTYAPPVIAFLKQVDLSGKKVVPFCTFGSGGLDSSIRDLKVAQPEAEVLEGYGVRAARMAAVPKELDRFLKAGGFIEGEAVQLPAFPEQHPASEEEAAILAAAIADYPMMQGVTASAVAARPVPDGTEYLFTAQPQPREDDPKLPPATEMKVYVLVEEGQAPVFTQVLR